MRCKLFCYRTAWHYVDAPKESLTWCHIMQSLQHPKHASKQWWENCNYAVLFRKMKKQIEDAAKTRFWVNRKMTSKLKYILRKHIRFKQLMAGCLVKELLWVRNRHLWIDCMERPHVRIFHLKENLLGRNWWC